MNNLDENIGKKRCKVCIELIHENAIKCPNCGQFQNWQRHLNFSSTILALLIALISVISLSVPVFINTFRQNDSNIQVRLSYVEELTLALILINQGNRPGHLGSGIFEISYPHDTFILGFLNQRGWFIKAHSAENVDYYLSGIEGGQERMDKFFHYLDKNQESDKFSIKLTFPIHNFSGKLQKYELKIDLNELKTLIKYEAHNNVSTK